MIENILKVWQESTDGKTLKSKNTQNKNFSCEYCSRSFTKETTLLSHVCEKKRRYNQKDEKAVRIAFTLFEVFYKKLQGSSAKQKTYDDFVSSPYYLAFVKFGRYAVDVNIFDIHGFFSWLLDNEIKIDEWCKDSHYFGFIKFKLLTEPVADAVERSIRTMEEWSSEFNSKIQDYFKYASVSRICRDISRGLISPWVIYCSTTGNKFLENIDENSLKYVWDWIDSSRWTKKFDKHQADMEWIKSIMKSAGI